MHANSTYSKGQIHKMVHRGKKDKDQRQLLYLSQATMYRKTRFPPSIPPSARPTWDVKGDKKSSVQGVNASSILANLGRRRSARLPKVPVTSTRSSS